MDMVGLVEAGMEVDGIACGTKPGSLVACREMPEHFQSAR